MSILYLTQKSDVYQYVEREEKELIAELANIDRNTLVTPITSFNDVMINTDTGHTPNDYAYTDLALLQLCTLISPGLFQLILDLCGQWRKPGEDKSYFSSLHAIDIFNKLVKFRFDRKIANMQLVRNTRAKTIDGIVGGRFRYLSNIDFYERVAHTCKSHKINFFEAMLYGRRLVIRRIHTAENSAYNIDGDLYMPGVHFENSEVGGRAIRMASMLIKAGTNYCSLSQYKDGDGGRVLHTGKSFERKLNTLFSTAIRQLPSRKLIEETPLIDKSLRLEEDATRDKHSKHLVSVLRRRKLNLSFAQRVVASAAAMGRNEDDDLLDRMPDERRKILATRTGYDLFVSLIREARELPLDQREIAEQTAFSLLIGKINI